MPYIELVLLTVECVSVMAFGIYATIKGPSALWSA